MIIVNQIRLPMQTKPEVAIEKAYRILKITSQQINWAQIHKVSVDARHKPPQFVYSVAISFKDTIKEVAYTGLGTNVQVICPRPFLPQMGQEKLKGNVVVCGLGPAGLFAALELAQQGFKPIVIERGPDIKTRAKAVLEFEQGGSLNTNANIQFGEGGAGTFSDGKLVTRIKNPLCARVTERLLSAGAPESIAYQQKPHIGTDLLQTVFVNLRKKLIEFGGEVRFNTQLIEIIHKNGKLQAVGTTKETIPCEVLVLAIGHSARDTFSQIHQNGLTLYAKPFSVGYRIEHLQSEIEKGLYHEAAGNPVLPAGEYQLSTHVQGRGVYTFCMCPGGTVVAATSEKGGVVTNGMSVHARNGKNANAAVVVGVTEQDFNNNPFTAIQFQQEIEQAAFKAGGGDYTAPAETLGSYLSDKGKLELDRVLPTYARGVVPYHLKKLLPNHLSSALQTGLRSFGRKLPGYDVNDAVLTGMETRTSSPVRIPRKEDKESTMISGVYPCGEGAGYAGGIMSAATDGVEVAKSIIEKYQANTQ